MGRVMLLRVVLFALMLVAFSPAVAQQKVDLGEKATAIIRSLPPIDFSKFGTGGADEKKMLRDFAAALGLEPGKGDGLAYLQKSEMPIVGLTSYHLEQRYQGIPVWGERIIVTTGREGRTRRIGGATIKGLARGRLATRARLSGRQAMRRARRDAGLKASAALTAAGTSASPLVGRDRARLVIYTKGKRGAPVLAYEVTLHAVKNGRPTNPVYLIDATNGEILFKYDNIQHVRGGGPGGNMGTGCYFYGRGGLPSLTIRKLGKGMCALDSENVASWDCGHQNDYSKCRIHRFRCPINKHKKVNGACSPLNDAHFFGQVVFAMYRDWYGIRPIKQKLNMVVHFGRNLKNAFWNGQAMHFGDGGDSLFPLVSLDIAAHEIAHGFTQQRSNLIYAGQPGGINEAFSDMAGEAAEAYYREKYHQGGAMALAPTAGGREAGGISGLAGHARMARGTVGTVGDVSAEEGINSLLTGGAGGLGGGAPGDRSGPVSPIYGGQAGESGINALLKGGYDHPPSARGNRRSVARQGLSASGDAHAAHHKRHTMFKHRLPDFRVGAHIFKKKGMALRYMYDPPKDGKSIASAINYRLTKDGKPMDVHHSSGVFNKAFYLLARKPGWNVRRAFTVFLVANAIYWGPNENFLSAALKCLQAAKDLKYNVEDVKDVFRAVDVFVNP